MNKNNYKVVQHELGYYYVENPPSNEDLKIYYKNKYYQEAVGAYESFYSDSEIEFLKNKQKEREYVINLFVDAENPSLLDVGCGEGWSLSYFKERGWEVQGIDYSDFGCNKFNKKCINNLIVGDIYDELKNIRAKNKIYDVIMLNHVLEHIPTPKDLILTLKELLSKNGILVISVPNDFSLIQNYALENIYIKNQFWVTLPDHLSYFNNETLGKFMNDNEFDEKMLLGDYPIDINLLNPNTNYQKDKTKGKSCYKEKIEFDNLIHKTQPVDKVVNFYKSMISVGIGRSIIGFYQKKKDAL